MKFERLPHLTGHTAPKTKVQTHEKKILNFVARIFLEKQIPDMEVRVIEHVEAKLGSVRFVDFQHLALEVAL